MAKRTDDRLRKQPKKKQKQSLAAASVSGLVAGSNAPEPSKRKNK
ncbi:hypothetical protein PSQ90_07485 [Devosia rhodophyticola]|uniref:Malic enzyme n=1 Tax=Devosia rhodophyticola TaxID=3026423 RepID=A0ABY7Z1I1_9HYPH|nr:hypothetical protein [Devosia rhodophyticola]WDR07257.1 hypothetical protein PSQ90_07485 [Devosia rhodophyticola]